MYFIENDTFWRTPTSREAAWQLVHVGIDVHKKNYAVSVICDGVVVKKFSQIAEPEQLAVALKKWFGEASLFSVYEAGFSGFKLHRTLVSHGIQNIVINPASIEVAANDRVKTDKKDSKKLAEHLVGKRLVGIYVPTEVEEDRRAITRTRDQLVRLKTRVANQIKGKLNHHGLMKPTDDRLISKKYLRSILTIDLSPFLKIAFDVLIKSWLDLNDKIKTLEAAMAQQAEADSAFESVYKSVPGVGDVSARVLANELGNIAKHFNNQKAICKYTGLTPSEYSSGEQTRQGRISRQGSPRVRHILTEVTWRAIRDDKVLAEKFNRIAARRGKRKACVAVARNLIGRIRSCFAKGELYCIAYA